MTCWLQQAYQELSESRTATENSSFAEKYQVRRSTMAERRKLPLVCVILYRCTAIYELFLCLAHQVFQNLAGSFTEQRRPVMTLLAAIRRRPELSQEQCALRTAWDRLEEEVRIISSRVTLPLLSCSLIASCAVLFGVLRGGDIITLSFDNVTM